MNHKLKCLPTAFVCSLFFPCIASSADEPSPDNFTLKILPADIQLDTDPDQVASIDMEVVLKSDVAGVLGWSFGVVAQNDGLEQFYIENVREHPGISSMIGDTQTAWTFAPGIPSFSIINYYTADDFQNRMSSAEVPSEMNEGNIDNNILDGAPGQWAAFTHGMILDGELQTSLPPEEETGILSITVKAQGQAPATGTLKFSPDIGKPPVDVLICWNTSAITPVQDKGEGDVYIPPATQLPSTISFASSTPVFIRGDPNADGSHNLADAVAVLNYLFVDASELSCLKSADANDDGAVNIADAVRILGYLFANEEQFPAPFTSCGPDPTSDALSCTSFSPCESAAK